MIIFCRLFRVGKQDIWLCFLMQSFVLKRITHPRHPISQKSDPKHQKLSHLYLFLLCLISLFILNFLQQIRLLKLYILHYSKATRFVTLIIQKWIKIRLSGSGFINLDSSVINLNITHTHTHTHTAKTSFKVGAKFELNM